MGLRRKIERNLLKKKWKDYNKGVEEKYKSEFKDFWKWYKNKKRSAA